MTYFMTSEISMTICCLIDLVYHLKGHRVYLTYFMTPKGHSVIRGRSDLLYDPKGHGDLSGRFDLVYDPKRSQCQERSP